MKLNYDCIRDILLTIESQTTPMSMTTNDFFSLLPNYSSTELTYCCWKLYEAGYLTLYTFKPPFSSSESITIRLIGDLTFKGHEFLADIKPVKTWEKIAPALRKFGSASFSTVANIASAITTDVIKNFIGLP